LIGIKRARGMVRVRRQRVLQLSTECRVWNRLGKWALEVPTLLEEPKVLMLWALQLTQITKLKIHL